MAAANEIDAWDAEAADFDRAADHGLHDPAVRRAWEDLLGQHLPGPPARVADLGSGTGTLSVLLGAAGYDVVGLDFSARMLALARLKAAHLPRVRFVEGDAFTPPLTAGAFDVVLCRHVLWAMPDPGVALERWLQALRPTGHLVLIEGHWSNSSGLTADETVRLVRATGRQATVTRLTDPQYWGREIDDERYLVTSGPQPDA